MRRALLALLVVASCDPYDPDLGDRPFLCGTSEPRCPSGYVGVDVNAVRCECHRASIAPDGGAAFECAPDPQERNDSAIRATATGLDAITPIRSFNASICGAGDEDWYQVLIPVGPSVEIRVELSFDPDRRPAEVAIFDRSLQELQPEISDPPGGGMRIATITVNRGEHYIRITAAEEINYLMRVLLRGIGTP
jgi:hypothetical protein